MNQLLQLELSHARQGEVLVIGVRGRLTAAGGDVLFRKEISRVLKDGEKTIVLDFHDLQTLDSSGLGELMSAAASVAIAGGRMAWAACPRTMTTLLEITLAQPEGVVFFDSAEAAAAALS